MSFDVDAAVAALWQGRVSLAHGLSEDELRSNQSRFGIVFGADHAALLRCAVPTGPRWPDWRSADPTAIRASMSEPVTGVLFDVEHNDYWHSTWGARPRTMATALEIARHGLNDWPTPIPVYGHRYQTSGGTSGVPVLSISQTDVIVYGTDLLDYIRREFVNGDRSATAQPTSSLSDPWLELALD